MESRAEIACPSCGGSGLLRLGDQSFRTCLDCLGQGRIPGLPAAPTTAAMWQSPPVRDASPSAAR